MSTGCLVAIVLAATVPALFAIIGILAAIAIPNFLKFQARAKQAEAKANLKAIYTASRAVYVETGVGATRFEELGWTPEPGHKYTYYFGTGVVGDVALPTSVRVFADPKTGEFQAAAVCNLDADPTLDVWVINQESAIANVSNDVLD